MVALAVRMLMAGRVGHILEVLVFSSTPTTGVFRADAATIRRVDGEDFRPVRTRATGQILEGIVNDTAVLANVFVGLLSLEEDVLALAPETMRASIAEKRLGIGILGPASLVVGGRGLRCRLFGILLSGGWRRRGRNKNREDGKKPQ